MPTSRNSSKRSAPNSVKIQPLNAEISTLEQHPQKDLFAVTEVEFEGIQMGVLSDGTPYLTMRGLARMCGVDNAALFRLASNWSEEQFKPRGRKIQELLNAHGFSSTSLYIKTRGNAVETHAYTDSVCMAILEYYAFESVQGEGTATAAMNFRLLARDSFRTFIYKKCNYDPTKLLSDSWRNFHERVLLNDQLPAGYFSIFREIADLVLRMISKGCSLDDHSMPDGSVGICWSKYWDAQDLEAKFGSRIKHPHFYPEWFPQSAANPIPAWVYPDDALGAFRRWMTATYMPVQFPTYIEKKVKKGDFSPGPAALLLSAVAPKSIT